MELVELTRHTCNVFLDCGCLQSSFAVRRSTLVGKTTVQGRLNVELSNPICDLLQLQVWLMLLHRPIWQVITERRNY